MNNFNSSENLLDNTLLLIKWTLKNIKNEFFRIEKIKENQVEIYTIILPPHPFYMIIVNHIKYYWIIFNKILKMKTNNYVI